MLDKRPRSDMAYKGQGAQGLDPGCDPVHHSHNHISVWLWLVVYHNHVSVWLWLVAYHSHVSMWLW